MYRRQNIFGLILFFLLFTSFWGSFVNSTQAVMEETSGGANLTGVIEDRGLDADATGKFDYLNVSVEVNVSIAGNYIIDVQGLLTAMGTYIDVSDTRREHLTPGIKRVEVYLYGPVIQESGLNPVNISSISLQLMVFEQFTPRIITLDHISEVHLSREYQFTEFDAASRGTDTIFTVYPNGSVALSGALNYTHMIPFNSGPEVHGTSHITRNGDSTTTSANYTFRVPKEAGSRLPVELPVNTTEVSYHELYSDTQFDSDLSVNMTLPPWLASRYPFNSTDFSLSSMYSEETGSMEMNLTTIVPDTISSMFPFNVTDVTITGNYVDHQLTGNITFHVISGFPIFDFQMGFKGNKTHLSLTGRGLVIYGRYPTIGYNMSRQNLEGMLAEINSTLPGTGPKSLYNMTNGTLNCTHLNTELTPYDSDGAWVNFDVEIHGDFIELMVNMMTQSLPVEDGEQIQDITYEALNATVNSVESVDFEIIYLHDSGEAEISVTFTDELLKLVENLVEIAEEAMALQNGMEATLSPLLTIMSINATLHYIDQAQVRLVYSSSTGKLEFRATSSGEVPPEEFYQMSYSTFPPPDDMPPETRRLFESIRELFKELQERRFCNLTFYEILFTYGNSVGDLRIVVAVDGDFQAQTDFVKNFMVTHMNMTSSKEHLINQTFIHPTGVQFNLTVGSTVTTSHMKGITLQPPIDPVNASCFKLKRFLNLTAQGFGGKPEPPSQGHRLTVTVRGGSNDTHTILLHRPEDVPPPNATSEDGTSMRWNNQSISDLKNLMFTVVRIGYQATFEWDEVTYKVVTRTNSTVVDSAFDRESKKVSFTIQGAEGTAGFCNVSIPKKLLNADPTEWIVKVDGEEVTPTITDTPTFTYLYFTYSHSVKDVEIIGTQVIPEFPYLLILPIFIISTLIAVALTRKGIKHKGKTD